MKKINFENAEIIKPAKVSIEGIDYEVTPAQLTVIEKYLSAETLNEMQSNIEESCVVVSPTEPTTNEKVWIQKGKNLLDINSGFINAWYDINNGATKSSGDALFEYILVSPSTVYTLSANATIRGLSIVFFDINKQAISVVEKNNTSSNTVTTPDNCYYVRVWLNKDGSTTMTNDIIKSLEPQLELEEVRTEYEPYIKAMHTKNDNGMYEPFYKESEMNKQHYSTDEQVIGTWTKADGKKVPLYSKMIETQAPTTTADGTYSTTLTKIADNIDIGFIEWAFITDGAGQRQPLPYINNSGNMIKGFINGNKELYLACNIKSYTGNKVTASIKYTKTTD